MDVVRGKVAAHIRQVVESFVRTHNKDEVRFLPIVFAAFDEWASTLNGTETVDAASEALFSGVKGGLGFAQEAGMDLVTPRVLAATYAAVFEVTKFGTKSQIPAILKVHGQRFRVPDQFLPVLRELLVMLVRADYEQAGILPVGEMARDTIVMIDPTGTKRGTKSELEITIGEARASKQELHLFFDDLANEFLVSGMKRTLGDKERRLLVAVFLRVGEYWEYAELFERVWGNETVKANAFHQLLERFHEKTGGILKTFIELAKGHERCYVKVEVRDHVKYALIVDAGAYESAPHWKP